MTIGAKRNALVKEAKGDILIHFDDDDHYAPHYVESMLTLMANSGADTVKAVRLPPLRPAHRHVRLMGSAARLPAAPHAAP
jgi:hypothetical protein